MSTTTATETITITRHEREVLWRVLDLRLSGDAIELSNLNDAHERREEFEDGFALLDLIGWEEDDARESFELPIDERLRRLLNRERDSLRQHVAHEALLCKQVAERDDGIVSSRDSEDAWQEWETQSSEQFQRAVEELHAVEKVYRRVWWKDRGEDRDC